MAIQAPNLIEITHDLQKISFAAKDVILNSKNVAHGAIFIAIKGERFDAHDYIYDAFEQGASLVIVNHSFYQAQMKSVSRDKRFELYKHLILSVPDTKEALGQVAALVRSKSKATFVALTGSSGKTSVKEMSFAILSQIGKVLATKGNFNNEIGVPLTLLSLEGDEKYAVIELGANHQGEIAYTAAMSNPQSVLINSICKAHLEGFGSLKGVAEAKSEIFTYPQIEDLKSLSLNMPNKIEYKNNQHVILNADIIFDALQMQNSLNKTEKLEGEELTKFWLHHLENIKLKTLFSIDEELTKLKNNVLSQSGYKIKDISISIAGSRFTLVTPEGHTQITLKVLGKHAISNALAATLLCMSVGASLDAVQKGLNSIEPVNGRLYPIKLTSTTTESKWIIDDTYNANVGSMKAAASLLKELPGYKVFVAGDMAEMGPYSQVCHEEIGDFIANSQIDAVYSVGQWSQFISSKHPNSQHFESKLALVNTLKSILKEHAIITFLVKGSRSSAMEEIVFALQER
ncbi:Mur ligase family protein [Thorsellia kenyensis]